MVCSVALLKYDILWRIGSWHCLQKQITVSEKIKVKASNKVKLLTIHLWSLVSLEHYATKISCNSTFKCLVAFFLVLWYMIFSYSQFTVAIQFAYAIWCISMWQKYVRCRPELDIINWELEIMLVNKINSTHFYLIFKSVKTLKYKTNFKNII